MFKNRLLCWHVSVSTVNWFSLDATSYGCLATTGMKYNPLDHRDNQLELYHNASRDSNFIGSMWQCYRVSVLICSLLDSRSRCRFWISSAVLYSDSFDVQFSLSQQIVGVPLNPALDWFVPTPPVESYDLWDDEPDEWIPVRKEKDIKKLSGIKCKMSRSEVKKVVYRVQVNK